jgi:cytochrome b pre-mRNA-processing protein 3
MILNLFRRNGSREIVERLHDLVVAEARRPALFRPPFAVPDTVEGRFELLTLHACLVLRRLSALPSPAPDLAQDLTNRIFRGFDAALREMGVGDLTVPKRMKRLAGDFGGRGNAYARALAGEGSFEAAVARNVYGSENAAVGDALAAYMRAAAQSIDRLPFVAFEEGRPMFPNPEPATP